MTAFPVASRSIPVTQPVRENLSPLIPGAPTKTDGGAESGPQDE